MTLLKIFNNHAPMCMGHLHPFGCLPVLFPDVLFVLHFKSRRVRVNDSIALDENSDLCLLRCSDLLTSSRFSIESFSVLRSLWCIPMLRGILPFDNSQTNLANRIQQFGFSTLINALRTPFLECLHLIFIAPTGSKLSGETPFINCPLMFLISSI